MSFKKQRVMGQQTRKYHIMHYLHSANYQVPVVGFRGHLKILGGPTQISNVPLGNGQSVNAVSTIEEVSLFSSYICARMLHKTNSEEKQQLTID